MRSVAGGMRLKLCPEWAQVDYALCLRRPEPVPLIFVESENEVEKTGHEVQKLCSMSAPLRVLITVAQWDDAPGFWNRGGIRPLMVERWNRIVVAQNNVWPNPGIIGYIVGERGRDDMLRFYTFAYRHDGSLHEAERVSVEKQLPSSRVPAELSADENRLAPSKGLI